MSTLSPSSSFSIEIFSDALNSWVIIPPRIFLQLINQHRNVQSSQFPLSSLKSLHISSMKTRIKHEWYIVGDYIEFQTSKQMSISLSNTFDFIVADPTPSAAEFSLWSIGKIIALDTKNPNFILVEHSNKIYQITNLTTIRPWQTCSQNQSFPLYVTAIPNIKAEIVNTTSLWINCDKPNFFFTYLETTGDWLWISTQKHLNFLTEVLEIKLQEHEIISKYNTEIEVESNHWRKLNSELVVNFKEILKFNRHFLQHIEGIINRNNTNKSIQYAILNNEGDEENNIFTLVWFSNDQAALVEMKKKLDFKEEIIQCDEDAVSLELESWVQKAKVETCVTGDGAIYVLGSEKSLIFFKKLWEMKWKYSNKIAIGQKEKEKLQEKVNTMKKQFNLKY